MSDQPEDLWLVDRLLAGEPRGDNEALTALIAAASAPGTPDELAGESAVVAAFTRASRGVSPSSPLPSRARRLPVLSTLLAGKVVAAAAAGGIAIAGTAAAAYTGNLPDALQDVAHQTIGAPAADASDAADERPEAPAATPTGRPATATPVGPDATGPAAYGLCTAWDKGGLDTKSVAYEALVKAAGDEDGIEEFCASVDHPGGASAKTTHTPTSRPTGSPTTHPTGAPESEPTAPVTHPTGAPETRPTGAPAKPTK
jgi:hypothetical protein